MTTFKPTHRLRSGALVELEHIFASRKTGQMSRKAEIQCRCDECGLVCTKGDWLLAKNPFDASEILTGCKRCHAINSFDMVCDEEGCEKIAGCGWPSGDVYRQTCAEHWAYQPNPDDKREPWPDGEDES